MFIAPKPLAALSSGLLARKGQARPAMRPQGYAWLAPATPPEDLGWNDMGPAPEPGLPPVLVERAALKEEVEQVAPAPKPVAAGRGKAAFTSRLDAHRHLRLRLASAVTHRSSQALLTQAFDTLLDTLPEVEALARKRPAPTENAA